MKKPDDDCALPVMMMTTLMAPALSLLPGIAMPVTWKDPSVPPETDVLSMPDHQGKVSPPAKRMDIRMWRDVSNTAPSAQLGWRRITGIGATFVVMRRLTIGWKSKTRSSSRTLAPMLFVLSAFVLAPAHAMAQSAGLGAAGELVDPDILRVCADPSNMPFSDESGMGFEDKLAKLVAEGTGRKSVAYTWFPSITGFVRNTLGANRCDIIMGYAQGDELVQNTNAYYRSTYVLAYRRDGELSGVETFADARLADKRIGVVESTPPTANMAAAKLMRRAKVYPLMVDTRVMPSMAELAMRDMQAGVIDAAVLWGPMAGYYAARAGIDVTLVPLIHEKKGQRMIYRITMGVRPSDQNWKRELNAFIKSNQAKIDKLLLEYGVPLLDEHDQRITQ